ncbi:MAG: DUF2089 family protein [Planctomycetota bacterium]|nr:MAG: DUF2089 family protein [Planctomycetota bacterium]
MYIEALRCRRCGTGVQGRLALPLLARLPGEYAAFTVELLLANGSLSGVQKSLECSYPKARRLLNETMEALRREIAADIQEKEDILQALEAGEIDGPEAVRLIRGFEGETKHD